MLKGITRMILGCQMALLMVCFGATPLLADTVPPFLHKGVHRVKIDNTNKLLLIDGNKVQVEIVIHRPVPMVRFAAKELQTFMRKATGKTVAIVSKPTVGKAAIVLGDSPDTREKAGIDIAKLPHDGFQIKRVGKAIYIAGRDSSYKDPDRELGRGTADFEMATLYGVYEFLERFMGVRFYFPGDIGTVVPKTKVVSVPLMDITEAPDLIKRTVSYYGGAHWNDKLDKKALRRFHNMGRIRWRGETIFIPNNHSMNRLKLSERFAKTNPEYFSLLPTGRRDSDLSLPGHPGQHCFSSKGLQNELYLDAVAFLTGKRPRPGIGKWWPKSACNDQYFNIMPNDGYGPANTCRCKACLPSFKAGTSHLLVWQFICDVARRLQKNKIPGYVTAMSYAVYKDVPPMDIPNNVLIQVAQKGPWKEKYPKMQAVDEQRLKNWTKKINKKVWTWNYINNHGGRIPDGVPSIATGAIDAYVKRVSPYVFGIHMQSHNDYALFQYLNYYVLHKLYWRTDADVKALVEEFNKKMFGSAAKPMSAFFARLESIWMDRLVAEFKSTPMGPAMVTKTDVEVWEQTYTNEVMAELNGLFDQAEKLAKKEHQSLKRVRWYRKHFLGRMMAVREAYYGRKREVADLVFQVTPLPKGKAITIDGKLDEPAWKTAQRVTMVTLKADDPKVKTRIYARWTADTLYLGYECVEPKVAQLHVADRQRDDRHLWQDASVEAFIIPSSKSRTYYQFVVNAKNQVGDVKLTYDADGLRKSDWTWNSSFQTATKIGKKGWTAEVAIPLKAISLEGKDTISFVANFTRSRNLTGVKKGENQFYTWSPFLRKAFHEPDRFGSVKFVNKPTPVDSLIKDGSFEVLRRSGRPKYWVFTKNPKQPDAIKLDSTTWRHGEGSIRISNTVGRSVFAAQMLPPMKPNTRYLLTYFVKLDNVAQRGDAKLYGANLNLHVSAKDGQNLFIPKPPMHHIGTLPWTKQGYSFTSGPNTGKSKPYIRVRMYDSTGTAWFDDIRLREVKD
jgi:Domain of unknown function (DUF4838)/Carbohydrate family 9 binding domain-like